MARLSFTKSFVRHSSRKSKDGVRLCGGSFVVYTSGSGARRLSSVMGLAGSINAKGYPSVADQSDLLTFGSGRPAVDMPKSCFSRDRRGKRCCKAVWICATRTCRSSISSFPSPLASERWTRRDSRSVSRCRSTR